ncbi:putative gastrointestinal growth factor xP1 [Pyxicephalus adspersus]|uniref:putative gastrointestinal growth factor xP1 n=1 Tax=Pyxicephalus adspersus TaxID=30357 RepID=UPI003B59A95E
MDYRMFCLLAIAFVVSSFSSANGKTTLTAEQCDVQPHTRTNCGVPGITPDQCRDKGCCFNDIPYDAIWCYYPHSEPKPTTTPTPKTTTTPKPEPTPEPEPEECEF